jgi:hypothetical protein
MGSRILGKLYALEVKTGEVHSSDLRSIRAFQEYYPKMFQSMIVSLKKNQTRKIENTLICGIKRMLEILEL